MPVDAAPAGNEAAVRAAYAAVAGELARLVGAIGARGEWPTPCAEWNVDVVAAAVVEKMQVFAAAPRAGGADHPNLGTPRAVSASRVRRSAQDLLAAYAQPGVFDQPLTLPMGTMPGSAALAVALLDALLHGWDLATALDEPYDPAADVVDLAADTADRVITDELRATGAFAQPVAVQAGSSDLERLVAHCGRDPGWRPDDSDEQRGRL